VSDRPAPAERASASERGAGVLTFLFALLLVGLGAALFAVAFRLLLLGWYRHAFGATSVVEAIARLPWWLRLLVPVTGGAAAGLISAVRAGRTQNVSNVMEAIALGHVRLSMRATLSRIAASGAAIAGGLSIGREGPLIEWGGSLGAGVGRLLGTPLDRTRVLVAAGTAAGFAAAYNTPFAAILFVFETMAGVAALDLLLPTMSATVLATLVTRALVGGGPIYGQRAFAVGSASQLLPYVGLGVLAALAAGGFKAVLAGAEQFFERHTIRQPFRSTIGGAVVGAIAVWLPSVAGNGYEPLNLILDGRLPLTVIGVLVMAKVVATSASVGSGVPGGVFTPTLLVGGALGSVWAHLISGLGGASTDMAGSYALVGMAAAAAASMHAPLTAAVMVFELSGDYPIVVPLILATAVATGVARALGRDSVYTAELRRRGLGWEMTIDGRRMTGDRPE
jgi:chloride channel protein, CIC family